MKSLSGILVIWACVIGEKNWLFIFWKYLIKCLEVCGQFDQLEEIQKICD